MGEMWHRPEMARSLRLIAETEPAACMAVSWPGARGELRQSVPEAASRIEDFARHTSYWVEPISTNYRGFDV